MNLASFIFNNSCFIWSLTVRGNSYSIAAKANIDLAIGVRTEDLGSVINVGGVEVIYGSSNGLSATLAHADQFWTQDSTNIDNQAEQSDFFGFGLA